jgi:hypothetical protein
MQEEISPLVNHLSEQSKFWCRTNTRPSHHPTLSEEFSNRVAESTRLILVKDGFGGDLGALDRWTDERRKDTNV